MMSRSHCSGCDEFSEDVGLRYAGKGIGYVNLCEDCSRSLRKGELIVKVSADGKFELSWISAIEGAE